MRYDFIWLLAVWLFVDGVASGRQAASSSGELKENRAHTARSNFLQREVDSLDGFVDFLAVFKADDHGVDVRAGHGKADGFLAVNGVGENAVAADFNTK